MHLISSSVSCGLLSGALHALTGGDHLAVLLPLIMNRRWYKGSIVGAIWGFGHGLTSIALGAVGFYVKNYIDSPLSSSFGEILSMNGMNGVLLGITLVVIGIIGIRENKDSSAEFLNMVDNSLDDSLEAESFSDNKFKAEELKSNLAYPTVFLNGIVLGISWDGLPSLAPTIAMNSWNEVILFLFMYCVGTMGAMAMSCGIVGEVTIAINHIYQSNVSGRLAFITSIMSIIIGAFWCLSGIIKCVTQYYRNATIIAENNDGNNIDLIYLSSSISYHHYWQKMEFALTALSLLVIPIVIVLTILPRSLLSAFWSFLLKRTNRFGVFKIYSYFKFPSAQHKKRDSGYIV
eukprot:gene12171-16299_t